jgi:phenylacetate-CoA ligase
MTPDTLPLYVERLVRLRPRIIHGYPSSLFVLALQMLDSGETRLRPTAVFTHSETLLSQQRSTIESAFGCKAYNWYGNTEMVGNIVECECGTMHVRSEHSLVEFLGPSGAPAAAGQVAEVVGTAFANWATPLIRYRLGDSVIVGSGDCPCGRRGPTVEAVVGRVEDIIVTPDGRHVGRLDHIFKDALTVREAQIRQKVADEVTVLLVPREGFTTGDERRIERDLRLRLGRSIRIRFEVVGAIPREPNGKFRFAVSDVPLFGRRPQATTS